MAWYEYECTQCDYKKRRYSNVRRCPNCRRKSLRRIDPHDDLLEQLAEQAHDSWSQWIIHMLITCNTRNEDGSATLPKQMVDRMMRQAKTPYSELTEAEKTSDRRQAEAYLTIFKIMRGE